MIGVPVAEETADSTAAAGGLTASLYRPANHAVERTALIEVLTNDIYYRLDSGSATPDSNDHAGMIGAQISVDYPSRFRHIRQTADGKLKVTYFER